MGFEPAISRVTRWSPSRIVGNSEAGEEVLSDAEVFALIGLPRAKAEPVNAAGSRERNSRRPATRASCFLESMSVSNHSFQ